jgi:hypothetical protein
LGPCRVLPTTTPTSSLSRALRESIVSAACIGVLVVLDAPPPPLPHTHTHSPQEYLSVFPTFLLKCVSERTIAWLLLWLAIFVSVIILALQIALPGSA